MVRTRLTLLPGQPGTKALEEEYGSRLVCVRYRYDPQRCKRYKTVELIVEETDWFPQDGPAPDAKVPIVIDPKEEALRQQVKQLGGKWNPVRKVWELAYRDVVRLGLVDRMVSQ